MKTIFLGFHNAADACIKDPSQRGAIVTMAIACALASVLPLPTSPVEDVSEHYSRSVLDDVKRLAGEFNESVVFDLRSALEQTRSFWLMRYTAAHPGTVSMAFGGDFCFFSLLMGAGMYVEPKQYELANRNKLAVLHLVGAARSVLEQLARRG